jgi:hypothetical protein
MNSVPRLSSETKRQDTNAMQRLLDETANQVAPSAHAAVLLDQAGRHTTDKLDIPTNVTLLPLLPRSPADLLGLSGPLVMRESGGCASPDALAGA